MDQIFQPAIDNLDKLYGISLENGKRQLHGNQLRITVKGTQYSDGNRPRRPRTIKVTLSAEVSQKWVNNPNFNDIWNAFGVDLGDGTLDDEKQSLLDISVSADIVF